MNFDIFRSEWTRAIRGTREVKGQFGFISNVTAPVGGDVDECGGHNSKRVHSVL